MFLSRLFKISRSLLVLFFLWIVFLGYQIFTFPIGKLEDKGYAAIVLGAAVHADKPSPVFKERLNHAINLYKEGSVLKLIFTGGIGEKANNSEGGKDEFAESVVAKNYALSLGVLEKDIFIETVSHTTKDNLLNAREILIGNGFSKTLIITDPLHSKRALLLAEGIGMVDVTASATPTTRYKSLKTKIPFLIREIYFYHHYLVFNE